MSTGVTTILHSSRSSGIYISQNGNSHSSYNEGQCCIFWHQDESRCSGDLSINNLLW